MLICRSVHPDVYVDAINLGMYIKVKIDTGVEIS